MNINLATFSQGGLAALEPPVMLPKKANHPNQMLGLAGFFSKLRAVLSINSIQDIVSWLPEGKIWRIHKMKAFIASLLPIFPEVTQWEGFVVLVKLHGFSEVSRGLDSVAFYNEVRADIIRMRLLYDIVKQHST